MGKSQESWRRALQPLFWWLMLVIALLAIRTHERLMERTRIEFSVSLNGRPILDEASATLDGKAIYPNENIGLGNHSFVVRDPRTETFTTNFFAWYGRHDFGEIKLKRTFGTLNVQANPPANLISITGPELSVALTNSAGTNLTAPTDIYAVSVNYPRWSQTRNAAVAANQTSDCNFTPKFGVLHLTCNKEGASYVLQSTNLNSSGDFPATLDGLPTGEYRAKAFYHGHELARTAVVAEGATNEAPA